MSLYLEAVEYRFRDDSSLPLLVQPVVENPLVHYSDEFALEFSTALFVTLMKEGYSALEYVRRLEIKQREIIEKLIIQAHYDGTELFIDGETVLTADLFSCETAEK